MSSSIVIKELFPRLSLTALANYFNCHLCKKCVPGVLTNEKTLKSAQWQGMKLVLLNWWKLKAAVSVSANFLSVLQLAVPSSSLHHLTTAPVSFFQGSFLCFFHFFKPFRMSDYMSRRWGGFWRTGTASLWHPLSKLDKVCMCSCSCDQCFQISD